MSGNRLAALCAALGCLALPVSASAETTATPSSPASTPAVSAPASAHVKLAWQDVGGSPPFALVGRRIVVRATVTPYVAGQALDVSFYLDGRRAATKVASVLPIGNGAGRVRVGFWSRYAGLAQARVSHSATTQQAAFSARSAGVRLVHADLGPGAHDQSVRLLQSELNALHYAVPLTGVFDEGTGQALIAYRKVTGLERVPYAGRQVFEELARHAGGFHVRYRSDG